MTMNADADATSLHLIAMDNARTAASRRMNDTHRLFFNMYIC
jgi:hypothetical protein